jgi:hypothetical protein
MTIHPCPTDSLPTQTRGHYIVESPAQDAPAAFAAALAREEGAKAMLNALQAAGVRVPLTVHCTVAAPLLLAYRNDWMQQLPGGSLQPDPANEARLLTERLA